MRWPLWMTGQPRNAHEWFAHLRVGKMTAATDERFRRWLGADRHNEQAFERVELVWELTRELEHDQEIECLIEEAERPARAVSWPAALSDALRARPLRALLAGFVLATVLAAAVLVPLSWNRERVYATGIGEQRTVVLADQSQITLNTATRVRVAYTRSVRTVVLEQGEATFVVTHDATHPFEVRAAGGIVRDLGTQFNVLSNSGNVTVAVLEGKVAVALAHGGGFPAASLATVVSGGREVSYSAAGLAPVRLANIGRINAWHARRIAFDNVDLRDAVAETNRYSRMPLKLGDQSLATLRVTGVFRVGETDAFVSALNDAFGVRAEQTNGAIVLRPEAGAIKSQDPDRSGRPAISHSPGSR